MVYGAFDSIDEEFENSGANCNRCNHELLCELCDSERELKVFHMLNELIEDRNILYEIARGLSHNIFLEDGEVVGTNADWLSVWIDRFRKYEVDNQP